MSKIKSFRKRVENALLKDYYVLAKTADNIHWFKFMRGQYEEANLWKEEADRLFNACETGIRIVSCGKDSN